MSAYLFLRDVEAGHDADASNVPKTLSKCRDLAKVIHNDVYVREIAGAGIKLMLFGCVCCCLELACAVEQPTATAASP